MEQSSNTAPAKQNGALITVSVLIILVLLGAVGYLLYTSKNKTIVETATIEASNATQAMATQTENGYRTINIDSANAPLAYSFEIPAAYNVYFQEGNEGGYGARITVLRESSSGIFENAGVVFWITAESRHNADGKGGLAIVETIYKNQITAGATYTTVAGNKAVTTLSEVGGGTNTTGYVNNNRVPEAPFIIEAYYGTGFTNGTAIPQVEYNRILQTLKVTAKNI